MKGKLKPVKYDIRYVESSTITVYLFFINEGTELLLRNYMISTLKEDYGNPQAQFALVQRRSVNPLMAENIYKQITNNLL